MYFSQTIHPKVTAALRNLGFTALTEIQADAVPAAAANVDVVIAAETGSGKTLCYLVPIWSNLLRQLEKDAASGVSKADDGEIKTKTGALILCPNATL